MINGLLGEYTVEKDNLKKLLVGARLTEILYNETFNLIFSQNWDNEIEEMRLMLTIDAPCWIGNRDEWINRIKKSENNTVVNEIEDCLLAYELTRLRYNNLIRVKEVNFYDDFFAIIFQENNILSIEYCSESDYSWFLEEVSSKIEQERMVIGCQGNKLFQSNMLF